MRVHELGIAGDNGGGVGMGGEMELIMGIREFVGYKF